MNHCVKGARSSNSNKVQLIKFPELDALVQRKQYRGHRVHNHNRHASVFRLVSRHSFHPPSEIIATRVACLVIDVWTGLKPLQYRIFSTTSLFIRLRMTRGIRSVNRGIVEIKPKTSDHRRIGCMHT